jgi:hypothetical protein
LSADENRKEQARQMDYEIQDARKAPTVFILAGRKDDELGFHCRYVRLFFESGARGGLFCRAKPEALLVVGGASVSLRFAPKGSSMPFCSGKNLHRRIGEQGETGLERVFPE